MLCSLDSSIRLDNQERQRVLLCVVYEVICDGGNKNAQACKQGEKRVNGSWGESRVTGFFP